MKKIKLSRALSETATKICRCKDDFDRTHGTHLRSLKWMSLNNNTPTIVSCDRTGKESAAARRGRFNGGITHSVTFAQLDGAEDPRAYLFLSLFLLRGPDRSHWRRIEVWKLCARTYCRHVRHTYPRAQTAKIGRVSALPGINLSGVVAGSAGWSRRSLCASRYPAFYQTKQHPPHDRFILSAAA